MTYFWGMIFKHVFFRITTKIYGEKTNKHTNKLFFITVFNIHFFKVIIITFAHIKKVLIIKTSITYMMNSLVRNGAQTNDI